MFRVLGILLIAIPGIAALAQTRNPPVATVQVNDLRVESLVDPVGIDVARPRMGWKLVATGRDVVQTAYQVQVAAGPVPDFGAPPAWDSGRIASDESVHVAYDGPVLASRARYFWRVRVWTAGDTVSGWSAPAYWEMGLLEPQDWSAGWIRAGWRDDPAISSPAPFLRREFGASGQVAAARIYATAHGVYELYLNGNRVGDRLFAPGFTSYHKRLQYQTYDVTGLLREGPNVLGAILADGWYRGLLGFDGNRNTYGTDLGLLLQLEIRYANGDPEIVGSDADWRATTGPIRASDMYTGETYDARLDLGSWSEAGYDDSSWPAVQVYDPGLQPLVADLAPPVRRIEEIRPVAVFPAPSGEIIADMGQNFAGRVRMRVRGEAGQTVRLRHGEALDADGNLYAANLRGAAQTDSYTLRGGGEETWEPRFTFHGFRYVALDGYPGGFPAPGDLTGIVIHSDLEQTGTFETSDPRLNRLQQNILWSQRSNFLEIPSDCPQRDERLGWTGDAQIFAATACFNMNAQAFLTRWLRDLAADQRPDGSVPWVIPDALGGASAGAAGWGDAAVVLPWTLYLHYGDERILEEQYPSMQRWLAYALAQAGSDGVWQSGFHFGDWLSDPDDATPNALVATAWLAHSLDLVSQVARILGHEGDAALYRTAFSRIRQAFRKAYVSFAGTLRNPSQTAYVLALRFGLLSESLEPAAATELVRNIRKRGTHLSTGFLGTPHINPVLTAHGYGDVAYDLLFQESWPSWLYPLTQGATTIWERWDGIRDGRFQDPALNSLNHYAYGAVGEWMYQTVGGLQPDPENPGYKNILIRPHPDPRLRFARARLVTGYGPAHVAWERNGASMEIVVEIPPNAGGTIRLPGAILEDVTEGDAPLTEAAGVRSALQDADAVVLQAGSGVYRFRYDTGALLEIATAPTAGPEAPRRRTGPHAALFAAALGGILWNYFRRERRRTGGT